MCKSRADRARDVRPGVYLTSSGVPSQTQRETAAILCGGQDAVITGAAALGFYQFRQIPGQDSGAVDVLIPARLRRASTGYMRIHRTSHLPWPHGPPAAADSMWLACGGRDCRGHVLRG